MVDRGVEKMQDITDEVDGPLAEAARELNRKREESWLPYWYFVLGDLVWLALSAPLWGTALLMAAVERRLSDEK